MKKIQFFIFVILLSINSFAQTTNNMSRESKSKAVEFEEKYGSFIMNEYYDLGEVKDVTCRVKIMTDLKDNNKLGCFLLGTSGMIYKYTGILDADELAAAIESLEYIQREVLLKSPDVHTEVLYTSRDDVTLGAHTYLSFSGGKNVYKWKVFVKPTIYNSSFEDFNKKHIEKLIEYLKNAQTIIEEKTK